MTVPPPADLLAALEDLDATLADVTADPPRCSAIVESREGPLFAWWSVDPGDAPILAHEVAIRERIGERPPLRVPPVLRHGDLWRLERARESRPLEERDVAGLVDAISILATLELPEAPAAGRSSAAVAGDDHRPQPRFARARRLTRYARAGLRPRDLLAARRLLAKPRGPMVTAHGDLRTGHVFPVADGVEIVDWETVGRRPEGWDLLFFWAGMEPGRARDRLHELTLESLGPEARALAPMLRYAAVVLMIAGMVGEPNPRFRDEVGGRRLAAELPACRRGAAGRP